LSLQYCGPAPKRFDIERKLILFKVVAINWLREMNIEKRGVALVSGASRGIGKTIALELARDGFDISFCYLKSEKEATAVYHEIMGIGRRAYRGQCDVGNFASVSEFMEKSRKVLGDPNVVVNCAGIVRDSPLVTMSYEDWHDVINSDLNSMYNICKQAVFEMMKRRDGCIVNISSVAGIYGNAGQANYAASKAGIIGFTKSLAKEVGPYGIRVNVIAPGFIRTDMSESILKEQSKVVKTIALRRIGEPGDVANMASFLISEKASYITGQVFQIDGGIVL